MKHREDDVPEEEVKSVFLEAIGSDKKGIEVSQPMYMFKLCVLGPTFQNLLDTVRFQKHGK